MKRRMSSKNFDSLMKRRFTRNRGTKRMICRYLRIKVGNSYLNSRSVFYRKHIESCLTNSFFSCSCDLYRTEKNGKIDFFIIKQKCPYSKTFMPDMFNVRGNIIF